MVFFREGDGSELQAIAGLWEDLRSMLADVATTFQHHYVDVTFDNRMEVVRKRAAGGSIWIVLAEDDGEAVGYCLSTIGEDRVGWLDSFYVHPERRREGIGGELLTRSIGWLRAQDARAIRLTVTPGNESVMSFYRSQGFELRKYLLELDGKFE